MSARIKVHLIPRAGRSGIDGWDGEVLRVRVAAPPSDGDANEALLRLLAKVLRVGKTRLSLVSGARSRTKIVAVDDLTPEEVVARTRG